MPSTRLPCRHQPCILSLNENDSPRPRRALRYPEVAHSMSATFDAINMVCPCCGSTQTQGQPVLWKALIDEWRLAGHEIAYINRQQGFQCTGCSSNIRCMAL